MDMKTRILAALWFGSLVNYLDRVAISVAGPSIMKSLAISPASFGIILSAFSLGYVLTQLPGGLLADKFGAKVVLVAGPIFWAVFTGATGLAMTLAAFVAARLLFGISEGLTIASLHRLVGDRFDQRQRALAMGITLSALAVAPALAGPFVGWISATYGWRVMFFILMVPPLLASAFYQLAVPSIPAGQAQDQPDHDDEEGSVRAILIRPTFWLMCLYFFAYNIAFWGYIGWMPSYLSMAHHISLKSLGILAGIPYVFAFFGLLLAGWLAAHPLHNRRPLMIGIAFVCAGASLAVAYLADNLQQSLIGLSAAAFFLYGSQGATGALLLDLAPVRYRATYSGMVGTAGQLGGLIAPVVVGFLVNASGTFASGFGFMIGALCFAAVCVLSLSGPVALKIKRRAEKLSAVQV